VLLTLRVSLETDASQREVLLETTEQFKKVVRSLREAINLNSFSDEIHGLPSIEKFIASMGSLTISRVGATRIYACGDRYLRNRPAQTGWKGLSMVVEAGSSEASAEE
jgi:hypothetical protein